MTGDDRSGKPKVLGREAVAPLPKRFYTAVVAEPVAEGGARILLDGRAAKTPKRNELRLPALALAKSVAGEWAAQGERIDPARMPLTRLANTALDGVTGRENDVRADIVRYAGSDLLCYRAERPDGLVRRQAAAWDPVLAWARDCHDIDLAVGCGIGHVPQPVESLARLGRLLAPLDRFRLTALHVMTTLTGSALLACSVLERRFASEQAWAAAHIDEDWQMAQWGADAEAQARRERRWQEMAAAARMLDLMRVG